MKLKSMLAVALATIVSGAHAGADHVAHWGYEGKAGPGAWGKLDPAFTECKVGKLQSPIDIHGAKKAALPPLDLAYHATPAEIVNNGHTVQVNLQEAGSLTLDGVAYQLVQFHFHTPSEEHVNGKAYPLVAHLVHKSADGKLAVVGVLLKEGKPNAALAEVFSHLPAHEGDKAALAQQLNLADLLPQDHGYYRYLGSLTTPPCSEGVRWQVMQQPVEVSKEQIKAFQHLYKMNARPVQPLNGRLLEQG